MTEAEWLECTDPSLMLEFLQAKVSDRKLRLFAVACCRMIWHLLGDERSRVGVEVAERVADALTPDEELSRAITASKEARADLEERFQSATIGDLSGAIHVAAEVAYCTATNKRLNTSEVALWTARALAAEATAENYYTGTWRAASQTARKNACNSLASCVRCIFGPLPFRIITSDPAWLTPSVKALAQSIYEERAFDHLPILADALEEPGCTDTDILAHCRQQGEHVRGCWVVDLVLGKK